MTTLIGKDAPLEESIAKFKDIAKKLNLNIVESNWLNPLPDLWSCHIEEESCPNIFSNGKGATHDQALASAYGELFERLATHMSFSDYYLGDSNAKEPFVHYKDEIWTKVDDSLEELPQNILNASLRKFYTQDLDIKLENLVDLQSASFERGVCSIPFTNARNGQIVYFPVNLLDNLYASNGMSAGNTDSEALVQGLCEIIERYVKKEIIKKGLALPTIPKVILSKYPKLEKILEGLNGNSIKAIAYDASLGGKFPVVCVVLFNQRNGTTCASFGAHPIFEVALERTLTELMQGRTFSDLDNFEEPTLDLEASSDIVNLVSHFVDSTGYLPIHMFKKFPDFKFVAWDFNGSTHDQYKALRYMIDKLGFDVYIRSYKFLDLPVFRIIVPGMSEVYPLDDLVYNNINQAIEFQEALLFLPDSNESIETYQSYFDELNDQNFDDETLVAQLLGLLPDEDSSWNTLRMGELKCLLALAAKNYEESLYYAKWTIAFNTNVFNYKRMSFYQCLVKVLETIVTANLNLDDFKEAIALVYSQKTFDLVMSHIDGNSHFYDLKGTDLSLRGFVKHQALISVFEKIKKEDENFNAN